MKWLIDAEWYDANKCLPPMDEKVLCAVKSSDPVWDKATQSFKYKPLMRIYLGSRDRYGWYIDGKYQKQHYHKHDVSYWTWLPKLPNGWREIEDEEND